MGDALRGTARRTTLAVAATMILGTSVDAGGNDVAWMNDAGGSFDDVLNWDLGVPGLLDTAVFDLGGVYSVLFAQSVTNGSLLLDEDDVTFDLSSFQYTIADAIVGDKPGLEGRLTLSDGTMSLSGTAPLFLRVGKDAGADGGLTVAAGATLVCGDQAIVGDAGTGSLSVESGGTFSAVTTFIGDDVDSSGSLDVQGLGAAMTATGQSFVGNAGSGALLLTGGGTAGLATTFIGDDPEATGTVTVSDPGSTVTATGQTFIGNLGEGALLVSSGGAASTQTTFIADDPGSTGTATIVDTASSWTIGGTFVVGNSGTGTLSIAGDGTVTAMGLTKVGDALGALGTITIDGSGSTLTCNAESFVGNNGSGSLSITNGGTAMTTRVKIGDEIGSTGTVAVTGPASSWSDSVEIFVGNFGTGTLEVSSGGTVSGAAGTIADDPGSVGTVTVDGSGSGWTTTGALKIGDLGSATLDVTAGAGVGASSITLGAGLASSGAAAIDGAGSNLTSSGAIQNGVSGTGELTITGGGQAIAGGGYTQGANGGLVIVLGPQLAVAVAATGTASLAGALDLSLADGFAPADGSTFDLVTADTVTGTFAPATLQDGLTLTYEPNRVFVTVEGVGQPCPPDIDGDGNIGFSDLLAILSTWGPCPGCPQDVDGSGDVGFSDLLAVLSAWGPCP